MRTSVLTETYRGDWTSTPALAPESVDLTEQTLTAGGTADPARHVYRLLPEVLAARIEKLPPYEYCDRQVSFRRVATADGRAS